MIPQRQNEAFEQFLETVKNNGVLDPKTTTMLFLAASVAVRCRTCAERFIAQARELGVSEEEMGAVEAVAMAVRAGSGRALIWEIEGAEA